MVTFQFPLLLSEWTQLMAVRLVPSLEPVIYSIKMFRLKWKMRTKAGSKSLLLWLNWWCLWRVLRHFWEHFCCHWLIRELLEGQIAGDEGMPEEISHWSKMRGVEKKVHKVKRVPHQNWKMGSDAYRFYKHRRGVPHQNWKWGPMLIDSISIGGVSPIKIENGVRCL